MYRAKPVSCQGCSCLSHGTDFSSVEGTGSSGVLLIGEASGEHEQRDQLPFRPYAPAGSVLQRVISRMGIDRKMLAISNCLRCRPRNNWLENAPWEYSALNHCRPNLEAVIAQYRPRCIVALGGVALRELTGMSGDKLGITYLAGYPLPLQRRSSMSLLEAPEVTDTPVIGNFHPAFLRRGKASYQGVFARILQRALNIASGRDRKWQWGIVPDEVTTHGNLQYNTHPTAGDVDSFVRTCLGNPSLTISYDLETSESTNLDEDAREGFIDTRIRLAQFSIKEGTGIALDWDTYHEAAKAILASQNVKCGHNIWLFDDKVLRVHDSVPAGTRHDTLQMFHHWQPDLPAHLQFASLFVEFPFPWKHLAATNIEFYGCADVDATLRLYHYTRAKLEEEGLWGDHIRGYLGQVYEVRPILAAMEDRGVPIDDEARQRLGAEFDAAQKELGVELAKLAPEGCQRIHPKEGYKTIPPEVRQWLTSHNINHKTLDSSEMLFGGEVSLSDLHATRFKEPDKDKGDGTIEEGEWYTYQRRKFKISSATEEAGEPKLVTTEAERWCRLYDFNPNSQPQVIAYMKAKGHPIPKDKHREDDEGNNPDTTNAKELLRLANKTGDSFYLKVIEYRGFSKLRGTYIDGFRPMSDGCVHTTFTFDTAIGQLSARNPNTTNFPKLKPTPKLAEAMRGMICAKAGNVITEWDFKSCHVITLGFLAEDLNYMRLGRLDIHSFVAGHFLGLWNGFEIFQESDEQLLARFAWLKSNPEWKIVRDDQAKHGILGIGNGLRAKGLFERYMEHFPATTCEQCRGVGRVAGVRGTKICPGCKGSGIQPGIKTSEKVLNICEALFAPVFAFQEVQRREAHDRKVLTSLFGYIRRFYEVYRPDTRTGGWTHGDQAEQAVAYRLANAAHAHMRETMKALNRAFLDAKYGMFNMVHDSLMFHFPEEMLEEHIRDIYPVMTAPSTILKHPAICPEGLSLGVESSWGRRWNSMRKIELPKLELGGVQCSTAVATL